MGFFGQFAVWLNALLASYISTNTARIGAEETMLENDQTKLGVLYAMARANREAEREQVREEAIAGIGSFANLPPLTF